MFAYCMSVLRPSEDAIYNRIHAARAARRYPGIVDMLAEGALSPTTVRLLARHLTPENQQELLAAATGKGKQAVEELLARCFPHPDVAPSVRKVARRDAVPVVDRAAVSPPALLACADVGAPGQVEPEPPVGSRSAGAAPVAGRAVVRPLAADRYEVRFAASAEVREKLRLAQDLLGHAIPSGDLAAVFDRALTLLVTDLMRKKFAATPRPRECRGQAEDSRNIPAEVQRGVAARDGCRCAFVAEDGRRCGERRFLEFHHVVPYAAGGRPTAENIQLRCRAHNAHEAKLFYGPARQWVGGAGLIQEDAAGRATRSGTGPLASISTKSRCAPSP
jgi:hypothetical protein